MRVYHYLEARWALDDIRRRRLKSSKIDDMNDPYEWKTVSSDHQASQAALENTEKVAIGKYGVLCFSRRWNNILMWSHYGDRHKGMCLGFDVSDEIAVSVQYFDKVLVVEDITRANDSASESDRKAYKEIIDRSFWGKYSGWSYEEEVRMHGQRLEIDEETGHYFINFDERLKLKEVIAGVKFPMSKRPIEEALKGYSDDVKIIKAGRLSNSFEIIVDEREFG